MTPMKISGLLQCTTVLLDENIYREKNFTTKNSMKRRSEIQSFQAFALLPFFVFLVVLFS
jgi:hypothetical protein